MSLSERRADEERGCVVNILFDKDASEPGLDVGWGLSALVRAGGQRWLFDTAWDGDRVLANAARLGLDLTHLDGLLLSHGHWDHAGGLPQLLAYSTPARVVVPASLSRHLRGELGRRAPEVLAVSGPARLAPGLYTTGSLPPSGPPTSDGSLPEEQAMLVDTSAGLVVITGCAHPGVAAILAAARRRGPVHALLGGFHGLSNLDVLEGIARVIPAHCTQHTAEILARFQATARPGRAGDRFTFPAP